MTPDEIIDGANELHTQATTVPNVERIRGEKYSSPLNESPSTTIECGQLPTKEGGHPPLGPASSEKPYSVFTSMEKWLIVGMTAVGGVFR